MLQFRRGQKSFMGGEKPLGMIIFALSLAGWILSACNIGASLPVGNQRLVSEPFVEEKKGYTIRYPQGWMYRWEDYGDAVRFFEAGQADKTNLLPGPTLIIFVGPIEAFEDTKNATDPQVILKTLLNGPSFNLNSKAGEREGSVEKIDPITVDGEDAAVATLRGIENGIDFSARIVFVHTGDRGAFILATSQREDWKAFNPLFEAMLASMAFVEPSAQ